MVGRDDIVKLYKLDIWPQDPYSVEGKQRFESSLKEFDKVLEHEWLRDFLVGKKCVKILEVCSGTGIGGVGLAKLILDRGFDVNLTLTDVRREALEVGKKWGEEVLNREIKIISIDARDVDSIDQKFDLALMFGYSAPHFSPWDMIKLMSSVSHSLVDDGIFLMQEGDRVYSILYLQGYAKFLPERVDREKAILSTHVGYDCKRGVFKRAYINLKEIGENIVAEMYFWNLAELMSLSWIFFNDVDLIEITKTRGFIISHKPRRKLNKNDFKEIPKVLKR